jgi:hypothetical protein
MTEARIRSDIRNQLMSRFAGRVGGALLIEEMEVCSGKARVDMAIICDRLIGIEIKGPNDDLHRLSWQVSQYSRCFDHVVLVVHDGLAGAARELIPAWWGIVVGTAQEEAYKYRLLRRPRKNLNLDAEATLALLWREEITDLWRDLLGEPLPKKASKRNLRQQLVSAVTSHKLRCAGISLLKARREWRAISISPPNHGSLLDAFGSTSRRIRREGDREKATEGA